MIGLAIKHTIAFLYLVAGSISDIKRREVADWANYGLIAMGFAVNLILSLVLGDYHFILNSFIGFGVFFLIALVMFYTGQWGGGDSKMLMGIGALYGMGLRLEENSFIISFLIASLLAGAVYGIFWSFGIALMNWKAFIKEYNKTGREEAIRNVRILVIVFVIASLSSMLFPISGEIKLSLVFFGAVVFITFYAWLVIKAVEKSCMFRNVAPSGLTEGDWIAKEVWAKRKKKASLLQHLRESDDKHADEMIEEDFRLRILKVDERSFARLIRKRTDKIRGKAQRGNEKIIDYVCRKLYSDSFSKLHSAFSYLSFRNSGRFSQYRKLVEGLARASSRPAFDNALKGLSSFNAKLAKDRKYFRENYFYDMDKEYISGPADLGIMMWQIRRLEKLRVGKILVKDGIPFVPSFFLGWVIAVFFGNIFNITRLFY